MSNKQDKGRTVSVRLHESTKAAMDLIAAELRLKTGKRLTNDGVIWHLIRTSPLEVSKRVGEPPADIEFDQRTKKSDQKGDEADD